MLLSIFPTKIHKVENFLNQSDIDDINRQPPEVRDKVGPSELIKYKDGEYDLIWSY